MSSSYTSTASQNSFTVYTTTNAQQINLNFYLFWLNGISIQEASQKLVQKNNNLFIKTQITQQYRLFQLLEHYIQHRPALLTSSDFTFVPLPFSIKKSLLELYYMFDESIVREMLGKKFNNKTRKHLEANYKNRLFSCRRQFDNFKRVSKRLAEETKDLLQFIKIEFCLSEKLANSYAQVLFLTHHKIDCSSKKKLAGFGFDDLTNCAAVFLKFFIGKNLEFDEDLFVVAKELKSSFNSSILEEFRVIVLDYLNLTSPSLVCLIDNTSNNTNSIVASNSASAAVTYGGFLFSNDSVIKILIRNILGIGIGLGNVKDVKNLILDLLERVVEVCLGCGLKNADDLNGLFSAFRECFLKLSCFNQNYSGDMEKYKSVWDRLMFGIEKSSVYLFPKT